MCSLDHSSEQVPWRWRRTKSLGADVSLTNCIHPSASSCGYKEEAWRFIDTDESRITVCFKQMPFTSCCTVYEALVTSWFSFIVLLSLRLSRHRVTSYLWNIRLCSRSSQQRKNVWEAVLNIIDENECTWSGTEPDFSADFLPWWVFLFVCLFVCLFNYQ